MSDEKIIELDLLWLAYLSGQYGKETLEWHKRNTAGFSDYVTERIDAITDADIRTEGDCQDRQSDKWNGRV